MTACQARPPGGTAPRPHPLGHRCLGDGPQGALCWLIQDGARAMRTVLGSTPFAGFHPSGEIARARGARGTHDLTMVPVALA